jgi:cyclohexyl-isocyanide hydratase
MRIGMLLFPNLTQLDLTGPHEFLSRLPDATTFLVARTREPVVSERGLAIVPTATFADLPDVDLLFAPGGPGQIAATDDPETVHWVRTVGATARWVTSACTGSLLLGAAGLLEGYRATTHWAYVDLLPLVGAIPEPQRVVVERNRITGGGVTAGIDVALRIAEEACGREIAEQIQLQLEYDPDPRLRAGHPRVAPPAQVARARALLAGRHAQRKTQLAQLRTAR